MTHYLEQAFLGTRSPAVQQKVTLHLQRFIESFERTYGHDRVAIWGQRDTITWRQQLKAQSLAPATINNHMASLSSFATWIQTHAPTLFAMGDPTKGVGDLPLPPLEPRALTKEQVRTLKSLCDRLESYSRMKGKQWAKQRGTAETLPLHRKARPKRDKALVLVLLSTGLRREELVNLNLDQLVPCTPQELRSGRRAKLQRVQGKGKTERQVFLSADARQALADYLEHERRADIDDSQPLSAQPLFVSAANVTPRQPDGRLSPRAINLILEQIGRWHDAEFDAQDRERRISPLRPHDLRHTFAFHLAEATGSDAYELERRLGHRSQRYIQRYTNPPESVAADYIEEF